MYKAIIRPFLFQFEPEKAHKITFNLLKTLQSVPGGLNLLSLMTPNNNKPIDLMGLRFHNRVGVAAGLDKNAELIKVWKAIGFGFAEIGTITPKSQPGNPKPRLYRLKKDEGLINRMGFNNQGLDAAIKKLAKRPKNYIVGGNIGKNTATPNAEAINDYLTVFNGLYDHVDYLVINVSCPNISDLKKLQDKEELNAILGSLMQKRTEKEVKKPVLLKISPDLNEHQLLDTLQLVSDHSLEGVITTNTSISREGLSLSEEQINAIGNGGLSGLPLAHRSTEIVRIVRKEMGNDFPIIGSGGIHNAEEAKAKLDAGADMLQLYTGFIYHGIGLTKRCLQM
jgi:dihydroorotate dehydrogenase